MPPGERQFDFVAVADADLSQNDGLDIWYVRDVKHCSERFEASSFEWLGEELGTEEFGRGVLNTHVLVPYRILDM